MSSFFEQFVKIWFFGNLITPRLVYEYEVDAKVFAYDKMGQGMLLDQETENLITTRHNTVFNTSPTVSMDDLKAILLHLGKIEPKTTYTQFEIEALVNDNRAAIEDAYNGAEMAGIRSDQAVNIGTVQIISLAEIIRILFNEHICIVGQVYTRAQIENFADTHTQTIKEPGNSVSAQDAIPDETVRIVMLQVDQIEGGDQGTTTNAGNN